VRLYGSGFRWVGEYADDRRETFREGERRHMYAGASSATNPQQHSRGRRVAGRGAKHMGGLKVRKGMREFICGVF